jgi:hypothetical protein
MVKKKGQYLMTREDFVDIIESSSLQNAWGLIEGEKDARERFIMRGLFFQACYILKLHFDMPGDTWK